MVESRLQKNNYKTGGTMKLEFEGNKFGTYFMLVMMTPGFLVMQLM